MMAGPRSAVRCSWGGDLSGGQGLALAPLTREENLMAENGNTDFATMHQADQHFDRERAGLSWITVNAGAIQFRMIAGEINEPDIARDLAAEAAQPVENRASMRDQKGIRALPQEPIERTHAQSRDRQRRRKSDRRGKVSDCAPMYAPSQRSPTRGLSLASENTNPIRR